MTKDKDQSHSLSSASPFRAFLDSLLGRFPERSRAIFGLRFGLDDGEEKTLEEIGQTYGITRERVRQVVDVMLKKLRLELKDRGHEGVVQKVEQCLAEAAGVMTLEAIVETLAKENRRDGQALKALLLVMPGIEHIKESEHEKAAVALKNFDRKAWQTVIESMAQALTNKDSAVEFTELHALLHEVGTGATKMSEAELKCWIAPSKKIEKNVFGQYGLCTWETIRPRGTRERAHLVLKVVGKPLHFREIARLIDEHGLYKTGKRTHPQTVHNELIKDKRFVLVGRGTYALSDWGYTRGTVRQVLADILKETAKPMTREELLQAVMKVRQVKKSTVVINLNTFFTKVGKNIYTLREEA